MAVKRNWRGLLSVALLAGGVLAYKLKASRKGVGSGVEESTAGASFGAPRRRDPRGRSKVLLWRTHPLYVW
jgi:hypothetical protein